MKKTIITCLLAAIAVLPASAAIIYLDLDDVVIPNTLEGVYINIVTGEDSSDLTLEDFNAGPWINLYFGGKAIATSDLLRPWTNQASDYDGSTAGNYFVNVHAGSTIAGSGITDPVDGSLVGSFVTGESASEFHMGVEPYQFESGTKGYLAFSYDVVGGTAYGWFSFTPNDGGEGYSVDLARSDTPGESLIAGVGAIPEPATYAALAGALAMGAVALRRRRAP